MRYCRQLFVTLLLVLSACSSGSVHPVKKLSQSRPLADDTQTVSMSIQRKVLQGSLNQNMSLYSVRVVPILKGDTMSDDLPEYRLFGIEPHSAYWVLGLRNADILVGADDYVIYDSRAFPKFIELLSKQNEGTVEIRRDGKPLLFKYSITD